MQLHELHARSLESAIILAEVQPGGCGVCWSKPGSRA